MLSNSPKPKTRGPRKYVFRYVVDWETSGWNGVSYTGIGRLEDRHELIRVSFAAGRRPQRVGKKHNLAVAHRQVIRAVLKYKRGLNRRRMLNYYEGAMKCRPLSKGTA